MLSAGAFDQDTLAGFIFTSVNYYDGKLTAYNGGTGVRPSQRGQQLTLRMYDFLIPRLKEKNVRQCVLEVLTENDRAIKAYRQVGFRETKAYRCFKLENKNIVVKPPRLPFEIITVKQPNWELYDSFSDQVPSFLDSPLMIDFNLENETIIEAHAANGCIGYAIYQPDFGRISQIGVAPKFRGYGIAANLIRYIQKTSKQKGLSIINVDKHATGTMAFFKHLGFKNQLDQYEMKLTLND